MSALENKLPKGVIFELIHNSHKGVIFDLIWLCVYRYLLKPINTAVKRCGFKDTSCDKACHTLAISVNDRVTHEKISRTLTIAGPS